MKGTILLFAAASLWSAGGLLIKLVDVSPMGVSAARSFVAAFTLMLLTKRMPRKLDPSMLLGGTLYALTVTTFVIATRYTTAANAIVLQYAAPVYVAVLSGGVLKEVVTARDWSAVGLIVVGLLIFFADGLSAGNNFGNIMGVLSGICFASLVVSLRAMKDRHPVDAVIVGNLIAAILGTPWVLEGRWDFSSCVGIALLGSIQLGFSYFLYTRAITMVTALQAVLVPVVEPLLNPLWVYLWMGERPSPTAIVGAAIVLGTVTWRALDQLGTRCDSAPSQVV
jgi:drug/metabolite transporter (DMT)-like permease